jgi:hypothetical protein
LPTIGALELLFAAATLFLWHWRPFFPVNTLLMTGALAAVAFQSPTYLVAAFNPVTLNVGMILLSAVGYFSAAELPSASRCLRKRLKSTK